MVHPHNPTLLGFAEVFVDLALGRNDVILVKVATAQARFLQTPVHEGSGSSGRGWKFA
jgi:hypothetical protein